MVLVCRGSSFAPSQLSRAGTVRLSTRRSGDGSYGVESESLPDPARASDCKKGGDSTERARGRSNERVAPAPRQSCAIHHAVNSAHCPSGASRTAHRVLKSVGGSPSRVQPRTNPTSSVTVSTLERKVLVSGASARYSQPFTIPTRPRQGSRSGAIASSASSVHSAPMSPGSLRCQARR